jgi:quinol monooxygenase YgiN
MQTFTQLINDSTTAKVGLLVKLESKPGKESEVEHFLRDALPIVQAEQATTVWFAIRLGTSTFGIFDAFPNESGRQAHLSGKVAETLFAKAADLFSQPPIVETFDALAFKLPV